MEKKEIVQKELEKLMEIRGDFLDFFDTNISKKSDKISFDFVKNPTLDSKKCYEFFFKLDYQARKLRGLLVEAYDLKPE
ncbi:MAG: hypothetical protein M0P02_03345 [Sulfurospirillaceae bacterium]|jgi:hypothetical protein|nr:hypothetical protein [Sulfurospirillaceae bacterium]MCK9545632.1 hypothetical protein [Sulfurospirillaceae bacterium]MDY0238772.1 hypothetical protein [Campylobacterales bacterium]NLN00067.1 hypothetical protein [Campylobacteraceae bacterium]